jgi:hypothetical protein
MRPHFLSGTVFKHKKAQSITNLVNRTGNNNLVRPTFLSANKRGRVVDFDVLKDEEEVEFGAKTIKALFDVSIPDKKDVNWIEELDRLKAMYGAQGLNDEEIEDEIASKPPLGREQRTIKKSVNIGTSALSLDDKIKEIKEEIDNGRAISRAQQAVLIGEIGKSLKFISNVPPKTISTLAKQLVKLNTPRNHEDLGLIPRFIDNEFYKDHAGEFFNKGMIHVLLITNAQIDPLMTAGKPVRNFAARDNGLPGIQLSSLDKSLGYRDQNRKYLDLEAGGLISGQQLWEQVRNYPAMFNDPDFSISQYSQDLMKLHMQDI